MCALTDIDISSLRKLQETQFCNLLVGVVHVWKKNISNYHPKCRMHTIHDLKEIFDFNEKDSDDREMY